MELAYGLKSVRHFKEIRVLTEAGRRRLVSHVTPCQPNANNFTLFLRSPLFASSLCGGGLYSRSCSAPAVKYNNIELHLHSSPGKSISKQMYGTDTGPGLGPGSIAWGCCSSVVGPKLLRRERASFLLQ